MKAQTWLAGNLVGSSFWVSTEALSASPAVYGDTDRIVTL